MPSVSVDEFRAAMASFAAGVTVVTTAAANGDPFGLTATAFSSVSRNPPLCLICISHVAEARPVLMVTRRFAVNFLATGQEEVSARFATHGLDKFEGVPYVLGEASGCPLLEGALASVECTVQTVHVAGDHDVVIGSIERVNVGEGEPLVYFRGKYCAITAR
jgi:flavin reductase (DIM6/NTAB) family NADH-FMN oxidoreductase RutF